jgi:hypothetical protein
MNFEKRPFKFSKEQFANDFKFILGKYLDKTDDTQHLDPYDKELMRQLVSLCMNALKSSDNKQEILDAISATYMDLSSASDESLGSQWWIEKEFFKKVILELLKTNS